MFSSDGTSAMNFSKFLLILLIALSTCQVVSEKVDSVKIGGIFDQGDKELAGHFETAVERVNKDLGYLSATKFVAKVYNVRPKDTLSTSRHVCELTRQRVAAFVGPVSPSVNEYMKSCAYDLKIPYLQTCQDLQGRRSPYTLALHPDLEALAKAYADIVIDKKWKKFAVIYDDDEMLVVLKEVLAYGFNQTGADVFIYEYDEDLSPEKMLKDIATKNHFNMIVAVRPDRVRDIILASVGSYSSFYNAYLVVGLDFHTVDMSDVRMDKYFANLTTIRMVDPQREEVGATQKLRKTVSYQTAPGLASSLWSVPDEETPETAEPTHLTTEQALMYDAVTLIAHSAHNLMRMNMISFQQVYCNKQNSSWDYGQLFLENLKEVTVRGLTGNVRINQQGQRDSFILEVLEVNKTAESWIFKKAIVWDPVAGLKKPKGVDIEEDKEFTVEGMVLRVVTVPNEPYTMVGDESEGQARFSGFAIDLIKRLAERANFTPEFYIAPDGAYGSNMGDGTWNGMIGELMRHKADIAIVDLSTTAEREEVVDFTTPFMSTGISILLRIPEMQPPSLFSFMHPFSIVVWTYTLTVYILISVATYVLGRLTPDEWVPSHPCDPDSEPENQFGSLANCFWFTMGSIMQQGSDLVPRAVSTRTLASLWYFFCLILISSYTANLAAFLTAARMSSPIENAEDLAKQTDIAYGAKEGGSTKRFFQNSNNNVYKRMWAYMESMKPSVFPKTNEEGIARVLKGDYAYLMEATSIEYLVERNCNLTQVGGLLDNKGYGIATPQGSPVRNVLEHHLIIMQEKAELQELKDEWWNSPIECPQDAEDSAEMTMDSLGGVFVTLVGGVAVGAFIGLLEFWWDKSQIPYGERDHIMVEFYRELILVLTCTGSRPNPESAENSIADEVESKRSAHSRQMSAASNLSAMQME